MTQLFVSSYYVMAGSIPHATTYDIHYMVGLGIPCYMTMAMAFFTHQV